MATDVRASATAGLVERPRLFALLDRGALGPVTLLSASAGSGKTMLLESWQDQLAGVERTHPAEAPPELRDPLSEREVAVLRFLPTNVSAAEIGSELFLSVHTVKTHMRKLYAKLDVHTRAEAVQRGRALGLLAPARRGG
jgi:ATP/maltotriose-dependent transcriptional regulator MalT